MLDEMPQSSGGRRLPGNKLVRQTSNSMVAGLPTLTADCPSSDLQMAPKFSARLTRAQVATSVKPAIAHSTRSISVSWLRGSSEPTVTVCGTFSSRLLKPHAMATSCTWARKFLRSCLPLKQLAEKVLPGQ